MAVTSPTTITFGEDTGTYSGVINVSVIASGGSGGVIELSEDQSIWVSNPSVFAFSRGISKTIYARRNDNGDVSAVIQNSKIYDYLDAETNITPLPNDPIEFNATSHIKSITQNDDGHTIYEIKSASHWSGNVLASIIGNGSVTVPTLPIPEILQPEIRQLVKLTPRNTNVALADNRDQYQDTFRPNVIWFNDSENRVLITYVDRFTVKVVIGKLIFTESETVSLELGIVQSLVPNIFESIGYTVSLHENGSEFIIVTNFQNGSDNLDAIVGTVDPVGLNFTFGSVSTLSTESAVRKVVLKHIPNTDNYAIINYSASPFQLTSRVITVSSGNIVSLSSNSFEIGTGTPYPIFYSPYDMVWDAANSQFVVAFGSYIATFSLSQSGITLTSWQEWNSQKPAGGVRDISIDLDPSTNKLLVLYSVNRVPNAFSFMLYSVSNAFVDLLTIRNEFLSSGEGHRHVNVKCTGDNSFTAFREVPTIDVYEGYRQNNYYLQNVVVGASDELIFSDPTFISEPGYDGGYAVNEQGRLISGNSGNPKLDYNPSLGYYAAVFPALDRLTNRNGYNITYGAVQSSKGAGGWYFIDAKLPTSSGGDGLPYTTNQEYGIELLPEDDLPAGSPFTFTPSADQSVGTINVPSSLSWIITNINTTVDISITGDGAQYRINDGAWTNATQTEAVSSGDVISVRGSAPQFFSTTNTITLTVGTGTGSYEIITSDPAAIYDCENKGFVDKNRRLFNFRQMQVENVLPEHFSQYYPKFIALLKRYYECKPNDKSNDLIKHLFASRDINETNIELLSYIEDELLLGDAYFEGFGDTETEKRAAANFSNTLFRSKGTKFAIEWFFRSFYGVDAEVLYPKENIFKINDVNSTIGPSSLRYLTDDKLYQTYALLVRSEIPISKWKDVFKLFSHPAGMYLGGEVLLSDIKNIITSMPLGDSAIDQKSIPSYTLSAISNSVSEGQSIEFTVTGSNVTNNIDALYYYIENLSTTNDDFIKFFDSTSPGYVSVNNVGGTPQGNFLITARLDSDETESTENFKVIIRDRNNFIQDSATISLSNILTTYSINTVGSTTFNEGDIIEFRIVGDSNNPPNQTLQYYVNPIGINPIDSADFVTVPPFIGSPASITVIDDSARFTLQTSIDKSNASEPNETFTVVLQNGVIVKDTTPTITVQNVIPTFDILFDNSTIYEGQSLTGLLSIDQYNVGTKIDWSLTGDISVDSRALQLEGSFIADSVNTVFSIPFDKNDVADSIGVTGTLNISPEGFTPSPYNTASFTLIDSEASYTIGVTPAAAAEGDSATFSITGANIFDGSTAYFYVEFNETDSNDFVTLPPLSDSRQLITFSNNVGSPPINLQFASNGDSNETFVANLASTNELGADLATRLFTITSVPYTLISDQSSINEGNTAVFTFNASGIEDGIYYYEVGGTNITASDFVHNAFFNGVQGSFTVTSGTGSFGITAADDLSFEGTESFTVDVSNTLGGIPLSSSSPVTINDTSSSGYTITVEDIREGEQVEVLVTPNPGSIERLYYEISGSAASKFSSTKTNAIAESATNPFTVIIPFNASVDPSYNGSISGTVSVSRGDYVSNGASAIATSSFNVIDAIATATLTPSDATPDEGDTVIFTISNTTNLPPTVYYSIVDDIRTVQVSATASSGQPFIPLDDTAGLTIGMSSDALGVLGTVTSVSSTGVTMSNNLSFGLSTGSNINFALPEVFADFANSAVGNTTSSTFSVTISSNNDVSNDTYVFAIYDAPYKGNQIASAQISIQDATTGVVDISATSNSLNDTEFDDVYPRSAVAGIRFKSDGTIQAVGNISPGSNFYIPNGSWITGSFTSSDYNIIAVKTNQNSGATSGSFGTQLPMSSDNTWELSVNNPPTVGKNIATMTVDFTISQISSPSNTDTVSITFFVESNKTLEGGGGQIEP